MKTKIVYTLVSCPQDNYYEQALLSLYSLRQKNPTARIELIVDQETYQTFQGSRSTIHNYVDSVLPVVTPNDFDNMKKSRFLKTHVRQLVKGDILFIDCDTIICAPLDNIDNTLAEIAMVADLNGELPLSDPIVIQRCKDAGLGDMTNRPYFNSGVIYAKDTPFVHSFYEAWYNNWLTSVANGVKFDQPALCATNVSFDLPIKELSGIWNCQYKMFGQQYLKQAKIMHYYSNNGNKEHFFSLPMDVMFDEIKRNADILEHVKMLCRNPQKDFFALSTVTREQYLTFNHSHFLYIFTNRPFLYHAIEKICRIIERIIYPHG